MDLINVNKQDRQLTKDWFKPTKERSLASANLYNKDLNSIIYEIEVASQINWLNLSTKERLSVAINYLEQATLSPSKLKRSKVVFRSYFLEVEKTDVAIINAVFDRKSLSIKTNESKTGKTCDIKQLVDSIDSYATVGKGKKKQTTKDDLIVRCLYQTGLRISDLVNLTNTGWSLKDGHYSKNIKIKKTKNEHTVFISEELFKQIETEFKGKTYLFESSYIGADGQPYQKQFTRQAINKRLKAYGISPHKLRHTIATDLASQNVNAKVIQDLLGHSDVQTTVKYYFHDSYNPNLHRGKI